MSAGALWANRRFRSLWVGETVSQFGDRITELALPLIAVTLLAATPAQVGVLTALLWLPFLAGPFAGAWVDRRAGKRGLLVLADVIRAVALLSLPAAYLLDLLSLPHLYAIALVTGIGGMLFNMAYQAFFVALVDRSQFLAAGGVLSASRAASFVGGPALGGVLIEVLTAPFALVADAVSFLAAALLIRRIPVRETPPPPSDVSGLGLVRDGLALVLRDPVQRAALGCTATVNLFTMIALTLLIPYASRELGLSAGAIGLALGVGAVGGLAGAALAPRMSRAFGRGRTAALGAAVFPASLALAALAGGPDWAKVAALAGMELLAGVGVMLMDVNLNALLAHVTPDDARGRRAGAYSAINYGMRPIGALTGGWLGTMLGLRPTIVLAGLCGVGAAMWLLVSPIRRIATLDDAPLPVDLAVVLGDKS